MDSQLYKVTPKKKIAIFLHGLGANGIDTLFANLSEAWSNEVEIYYFLAVDNIHKQFWEDRVRSTNVKLIKLHDLDRGRLKKFPATIRKALKEYGPFDAVHANMDWLNGIILSVARFTGVKNRISHVSRNGNILPANRLKAIITDSYWKTMRFLIHVSATVRIGCSREAGEFFYGKDEFVPLANAIDLSAFRISDAESKEIIASVPEYSFITVGRLMSSKNPFFLLEIFEAIHNSVPAATLTWIGGGEFEKDIREMINRKGLENAVKMLGTRHDVPALLKRCKYFLLPSKFEGFALVLAEAQAAGLDCFASDTCSRLSFCGKVKYISLQKTPEEWARDILEYIDSAERMVLDKDLLDKLDIKSIAREIEKFY